MDTIHLLVFWSQKMTCGSLGDLGDTPELAGGPDQAGGDTEPPRDGDDGGDLEGEPGCAGGLPDIEPPEDGLPPLMEGDEGRLESGK